MSNHTTVPQLSSTVQETQQWLDDLSGRGPIQNVEQAYSVLRAVLHAVRDRLTADEAAHLASQLPMLVRGFYYEGWRPSLAPNEFDTVDEFLERIDTSLGGSQVGAEVDIRAGTRATLAFLTERIDEGQMRHVLEQLPGEVQTFVAEATAAG